MLWRCVILTPRGIGGGRPTVDQRRLYALGIDAYRVAQELAQSHYGFEMAGVTGQLTVQMQAGGVTYFQRQQMPAVYSGGVVVPLIDH